jgi:hypothetical protein
MATARRRRRPPTPAHDAPATPAIGANQERRTIRAARPDAVTGPDAQSGPGARIAPDAWSGPSDRAGAIARP